MLGRQVEELARNPAGYVKEGGFGERLVHPPDVAAEHFDQMPDRLRVLLEESRHRLPLQRDAPGRHHRLGIHGSHRLIFEEGQLPEAIAWEEDGEDRLSAAAPHSGDFHLAANDDVEDGCRVALVEDVGARRVAPNPDCRSQLLELLDRDSLEQHRPGKDRYQVHGGMIGRCKATSVEQHRASVPIDIGDIINREYVVPIQKMEDRQAVALSTLADPQAMARAHVLDVPAAGGAGNVSSPYEDLVSSLLEGSDADLGWLAWRDSAGGVVVRRPGVYLPPPTTIADFPDPPLDPLHVVDGGLWAGPWPLWCRAHAILSCLVVPVRQENEIVGTIGLASCRVGALDNFGVQRLQLGASLAIQTRNDELRLTSLRRLFDEVSRTLENALAVDRALRFPPTYREIARAVGESLDATYCQIAIRDARQVLTIRAAGGHRPPRKTGTAWPLRRLRLCAQALHERRAEVLEFSRQDVAAEPERLALFSPTTKTGVLLPFFAGPRTQGLLILGEERESRGQLLSPQRVAILELVASRIAHIMQISRRLEYERTGDRRRQRQLTVERQRLARDLHDKVGQSLSALLVQIRCAIAEGKAEPHDLQILEQAARGAVDGAVTLAYGIRNLEHGIGALEEARSYAETMLRSVHCRLSWTEERTDLKIASRVLREIAHVIKEAVTNIVRHAKATSVRIRVEYPDGRIRVTIHDDGIGFSVHEARPSSDGRGLGLVGCFERLSRVGGTFDVRSTPNRGGTLVLIEARRT